jgi:outer membrane protein OmpA-like peptidoglycan-associated protein
MKARYLAILPALLLTACSAGVDVKPMLQDFDAYSAYVKTVATDEHAIKTLEAGQAKRDQAGALVEKGKQKEALPVAEEAMADARLALEVDKMMKQQHLAEECRLEVEQARTKYSEAVYVLEQTEEFIGTSSPYEIEEPQAKEEKPLPNSTLKPETFPSSMGDISTQWTEWRDAAAARKVDSAEFETVYRRSFEAASQKKIKPEALAHQCYLAGRAVQGLECRVRAKTNETVCYDATRQTAKYGDARDKALRATLDLERGLKDSLRQELEKSRAEAKTRQEELYKSLSQLEGKYASVRRDARGTIVSLADILFDFDKATLRRDVEFNLVKIATILNQYPEMNVLIEGHTDAVGTDEYNLGLSQRRAQAVYDFMIEQGDVAEARLQWAGYGESRPVAPNDTDANRQKNRRVDLVIQDTP